MLNSCDAITPHMRVYQFFHKRNQRRKKWLEAPCVAEKSLVQTNTIIFKRTKNGFVKVCLIPMQPKSPNSNKEFYQSVIISGL